MNIMRPLKYFFSTLYAFLFVGIVTVSAATGTFGGSSSGGSGGGGLRNPLKNINSFEAFVAALLKAAIYIGLPIAVLFIVYSGFLFITAQGNDKKLTDAKTTFYWTVIGVAIFLGSWALAKIIESTVRLITG
ncbi:hypothetical protein A3D62_03290 [Candidatus Kaiserbacteria bacterium RIFCSPHIGHO2_02_FULL_49_11]|uniref:TrbC/VIRB2 family protein n=1 Tax=Candidatus Kaiserbacteria bacterium RIFCSPHIGHO2_02_FULL_49_11 TaxID=1798489 RepID=A0A1F6CZW4_9BACT|nr:MAG: hypothetical protein A3D62_03290 [Candidatus Kaiserbacteria bacterium RIFCSPHIGHO2_02_FULL_49_11]